MAAITVQRPALIQECETRTAKAKKVIAKLEKRRVAALKKTRPTSAAATVHRSQAAPEAPAIGAAGVPAGHAQAVPSTKQALPVRWTGLLSYHTE